MREPVNRVLSGIVKGSALLRDRVDETSKTLPKQSQSLFLLNQVRGFVKELLLGDYAIADDALARNTAKRLATRDQQDRFIKQALELLDVLTEVMNPWNEIVDLPLHSDAANRIPTRRAAFLNLSATGLVLIGHIGYEINMLGLPEPQRFEKYRELGTRIDWRRTAPIWTNTVLIPDLKRPGVMKVLTNRGPVKAAILEIEKALGLSVATVGPTQNSLEPALV